VVGEEGLHAAVVLGGAGGEDEVEK